MAEDDYTHSYQVNQDNKEYILTTQLINDTLRLECQDNNLPEQPVFSQLFTLNNFKDLDYYFQPFNYINQIQDELNKTIEQQTVSIYNNDDNTINISFLLKNDINTANITLQLQREFIEQPQEQLQQPQKQKEEPHNFEFQGRCSCPLDNERIDKLETDSGKLQADHEFLRNEINQLLEKINGLKTRINTLKEDNAQLNQKTMALREENNTRRIEANRLRENNEAIKRQNQQLREKKNRLEFLLKEHHDPYESQFVSKTNQTPFGTKPLQLENNNQLGQRTGGATMMPSIAPVGVGANNKINNSKPIIVSSSYENNPINTDFAFSKGTIIRDKNELEMIVNKINKFNRSIKIDLIYKASVDTDKASAFHYNCDNAKSTIVLIESTNGRRFGGFTSQSWEGDCVDKKDNNAFVFSLDKMQIYDVIPEKDAIGCYPDFGPVFLGCQIRIYDNAFSEGGSTFERGVSYLTNEDFELTGGEKKFNVKEIEVYEVRFE
jgi:regulator of replication initiation timing